MSHTCTPILVGVTSPVSEILLPKTVNWWAMVIKKFLGSKNSCNYKLMSYMHTNFGGHQFSLSPWTIVHGHQKISIGIGSKNSCNYKLMSHTCTNFGGRDFSGFGDTATATHGLSPWSSKNLIDRNRLKKFDVHTCTPI